MPTASPRSTPHLIRTARPEDVPALRRIIVQAFGHHTIHYLVEARYGVVGGKAWDRRKADEIESFYRSHPQETLVTEEKGKVLGFITYSLDRGNRVGTILNNAVDPASQKKGIGTAQIKQVLEIFRREGMRLATVVTGLGPGYSPARRMYEKCGFEPIMDSVTYYARLG